MMIDKYLIITKSGTVTVREREPRLAGNEIALRLRLEVPDALFQRPILRADMKIPDDAIPRSKVDVAITDNIEKIIEEATGLKMYVTIEEHESDPGI